MLPFKIQGKSRYIRLQNNGYRPGFGCFLGLFHVCGRYARCCNRCGYATHLDNAPARWRRGHCACISANVPALVQRKAPSAREMIKRH